MRRRRWLRMLMLTPITLGVTLVVVGCALTCRPSWYRPRAIDYARLEADKLALTDQVDRIGAALNERRTIEIVLDEDQVNRWIAAREEWPDFARQVDISPLRDPQIMFLSGNRVRLAATIVRAGFGMVASGTVALELVGDQLVFRWDAASIGALPLPRGLIERAARKLPQQSTSGEDLLERGELRLSNDWVWPNGKVRYRIRGILIRAGTAHVTLEPR